MLANVARAALTWLSHDDRPRLLLDSALHVLWHNEQALRATALLPAIAIRDSRLYFRSHEDQHRFVEEIRQLGDEPGTWAPRDLCADGVAVILARRILLDDAQLIALELYLDGCIAAQRYIPYYDQFGLTAAETAVLQGFTDGLSPQQIAAHRRVGIETIRAQIRTLYQKLGVCSREQMFRKIAPFRR